MRYIEFLRRLHELLAPPTYLEIGVRKGKSLSLSRARSVGIDPEYSVTHEIDCDVALFRTTSDDYFARPEPRAPVGGRRFALSFIDGMHLFEFALRDFINVERHSDWWSAIVMDDIFPGSSDEAARERHTRAWTGDVYKVLPALERFRPDLTCLRIDTRPTGLLVVLRADPSSEALSSSYEELCAEHVTPDPQDVPRGVLERSGALAPQQVLDSSVWQVLREGRERSLDRDEGLAEVTRALDGDLGIPRSGLLRRAGALLRGGRGA